MGLSYDVTFLTPYGTETFTGLTVAEFFAVKSAVYFVKRFTVVLAKRSK
jgi:cell shape-determining protein MreD